MESSNAVAIFNKVVGKKGKMCLVLVKPNLLVTQADPVYVPIAGVLHFAEIEEIGALTKGDSFAIPAGYKLVNVFGEDGEQIFTKADDKGVTHPLKQLAY